MEDDASTLAGAPSALSVRQSDDPPSTSNTQQVEPKSKSFDVSEAWITSVYVGNEFFAHSALVCFMMLLMKGVEILAAYLFPHRLVVLEGTRFELSADYLFLQFDIGLIIILGLHTLIKGTKRVFQSIRE